MASSVITAPDGTKYKVTHPEGASQAEIIKVAQQQISERKDREEFSPTEMVKNVPGSAVQLVTDMTYPLRHPIKTFQGMQNLASGVAQKIAAGDNRDAVYSNQQGVNTADAVTGAMKDRYGGWDNILNTLEKDPVGLLSDLAAIPSLAAKLPGKTGQIASKVAAVADPVSLGGNLAKSGAKVVADRIGDAALRQKYLESAKFSTTISQSTRDRMAQTALDEQIMPTYKGADALSAKIDKLGSRVGSIITELTSAGESVPKSKLLAKLKAERNKVDKVSERQYEKVISQWDSVIDDYTKQWDGVDSLTPEQVQAMKRSLDSSLFPNPSQGVRVKPYRPGTEQAEMSARTAAKESLEDLSPELSETNSRLSRLKELQKGGLERSANRIENNNAVPLDSLVAVGSGGAVGGAAGALAGTAVGLSQAPKPRAWVALAIKRLKNSPQADIFFTPSGTLTAEGRRALVILGRLGEVDREANSQAR